MALPDRVPGMKPGHRKRNILLGTFYSFLLLGVLGAAVPGDNGDAGVGLDTTTTSDTTIAVTTTTISTPADTTTRSPSEATTTAAIEQTSWTVTVDRVIDGDTMDVRMPDGSIETVRLLGVDTPETNVNQVSPDEWDGIPESIDGRDHLVNWGNSATVYAKDRLAGTEIYIETDPEADRRGSFGRLLVYAYQSRDSAKSFNLRLIEKGYARLYESQFQKRTQFADAESIAHMDSVGVWSYQQPETTTTKTTTTEDRGGSGDLAIANIHADAPGNDHQNLNEEYITFENTGDGPLDMTGWTLADEVDHTYRFPSGFTIEPGDTVTVYTGSGTNSDSELYWGSNSAIWNNGGDTIYVRNDNGVLIIEHEYPG